MIREKMTDKMRAERNVMAEATNPWIVKLYHSFQDKLNLYLVMEFLPGGDFKKLLRTHETLTEKETRFYMAELALAIQYVHQVLGEKRTLNLNLLLTSSHSSSSSSSSLFFSSCAS